MKAKILALTAFSLALQCDKGAPLGALPEVCKPWRHIPEREIPAERNPRIPGERSDRMRCGEAVYPDGHVEERECEFFAFTNVSRYALDRVYFYSEKLQQRVPNGGGWDCTPPFTADQVNCTIDVNDDDGTKIELVHVSCDGTRVCTDCCTVTQRDKVYEPEKPLAEDERRKFALELWENRKARYETCRPWCSKPEFASQCASYWNRVGEPTL